MIDSRDSLLVGDNTNYLIHVVNQGSADSHHVSLVVKFPNTIQPIPGGAGSGVVRNDTVTFNIPNLRPQESKDYRVETRAVAKGNQKIVLTVNSKFLSQPVIVEESTTVY